MMPVRAPCNLCSCGALSSTPGGTGSHRDARDGRAPATRQRPQFAPPVAVRRIRGMFGFGIPIVFAAFFYGAAEYEHMNGRGREEAERKQGPPQ